MYIMKSLKNFRNKIKVKTMKTKIKRTKNINLIQNIK